MKLKKQQENTYQNYKQCKDKYDLIKKFKIKKSKYEKSLLRIVDEKFKKDREVVLEAVKQDGFALEYADEILKKDREVVLAAVKSKGAALRLVDEQLKKEREIVLAAVKQDAKALKIADEQFKKDREIILEAVKQNGEVLQIATVKFDEKTGTNIQKQYLQWQSNIQPYKDIFIDDNQLNIAQIDQIVSQSAYEERIKFMQYKISQTLMDQLSYENTKLTFLMNTVKEQLSAVCQKPEIKIQLNDLYLRLNELLRRYDLITESTLVQIQANSSLLSQYLKFFSFSNEYDSFKSSLYRPDPVQCVSDLYIVQCSNADDRYKILPFGFTLIDSDMSKGAGGLNQYLAYKMGLSDTANFINDILPVCQKYKPSDWPNASGNQGGDINKGSGRCYKYVYYQKAGKNTCITELFIAYGKGYKPPSGYVVMGEDLNKGNGGDFVWLVGKKQTIERIQSLKENNQIHQNLPQINQFLKI